jgi:hypothetical protein
MKVKDVVNSDKIYNYISKMFTDIHEKRILSISNAVIGIITSASLAIHLIGQGLAAVKGTITKHGVKQVDRLLSNIKFNCWLYFYTWVPQVVGSRKQIIVAMDWTNFDKDKHSTIAIYLVTSHGRATPLIWKTHSQNDLKNNQNRFEKEILEHLKKTLSDDIEVTVLADRGFGYVEFYNVLSNLNFKYVIRFKGNINVKNQSNEVRSASEWLKNNGFPTRLENAFVTQEEQPVPVVVCVRDKDMKDVWCLASNDPLLKTREIINLYAKRWSIETKFRDQKNLRFGFGMYNVIISNADRRDRLFFLGAIADLLLTILGAAGELLGFDRMLKANTSKRRVHSLFKQGLMWYELIPNMPDERLSALMKKFSELLGEQAATKEILSFA